MKPRLGQSISLNAFLALFSFAMVYPWLIALSTAIKNPGESAQNPGVIPHSVTLANFVAVFSEIDVPRLAFNSLVITGSTVALVLIVASLAAFAFARLDFIFKEKIYYLLLTGLMLNGAILIVPLYQVNAALHVLNTHVALIGPYVALSLPLAVIVLRGFFQRLPAELDESASIDGASTLTVYRKILLPLTRPALVSVGIFVGLSTWNDFLLPIIMTSSSDMRTLPLGLLVFVGDNMGLQYEPRFALIAIMSLPVVILFIALQRLFVRGLTAGVTN